MNTCHLCGHDGLREIPEFGSLGRVTSDCRPWPPGGRLAWCSACATVQKPVDARWREEAAEVYARYDIYHQSGGAEQSVFVQGVARTRSRRVLDCLQAQTSLAPAGRALDYGCGNGAFAAALSERLPQWELVGTDLSPRHRQSIERLPRTRFMTPDEVGSSIESFDLISLIHSLEHIPHPRAVLSELAGRLRPGSGRLLVQVPYFVENPFELLVTDHCSHFVPETLGPLLARSKLGIECLTTTWVDKEISALAFAGASAIPTPAPAATPPDHVVTSAVRWLRAVENAARQAAAPGGLGIFGTSISATWLAGCLDRSVLFFVDEDPARVGREHLGRPILTVDAVPREAGVYVPLPPKLAVPLRARLEPSSGGRFIYPPPLSY